MDLFSLKGFSGIGSIWKMVIQKSDKNIGIRQVEPGVFVCSFSGKRLLEIVSMLRNYSNEDNKYFWLDDESEISLLLSFSGRW